MIFIFLINIIIYKKICSIKNSNLLKKINKYNIKLVNFTLKSYFFLV